MTFERGVALPPSGIYSSMLSKMATFLQFAAYIWHLCECTLICMTVGVHVCVCVSVSLGVRARVHGCMHVCGEAVLPQVLPAFSVTVSLNDLELT